MEIWRDYGVNKLRIRGFEKVQKYKDIEVMKPIRATTKAAGYDMAAAHDVVIRPLGELMPKLLKAIYDKRIDNEKTREIYSMPDADAAETAFAQIMTLTFEEMKAITKETGIKPTLISTGHKAYMKDNEVLELAIRSGCPLNAWLILANPPGEVDADYYDNVENEGEIFFQIINLSPVPIHIKKGDILGQGIFKQFFLTDDDHEQPKKIRAGGFNSTGLRK